MPLFGEEEKYYDKRLRWLKLFGHLLLLATERARVCPAYVMVPYKLLYSTYAHMYPLGARGLDTVCDTTPPGVPALSTKSITTLVTFCSPLF